MAEIGVLNSFHENFGGRDASPELLGLELASQGNDEMFRPSIADDQKIGFFRLDRATQTEVSEVVEIKQLSDNVHQLLEDAQSMRRDINFAQSVMQADFEAKLQQKAIDMYVRVNEKVSDVEKMQEERVNTVRRAFRQQLTDAIARMHTLYQQDFARKLDAERSNQDQGAARWEKKIRELQHTIVKNENIIAMLKQQIQDINEKEPEQIIVTKTPSPDLEKEQELDDLRDQVVALEDDLARMEDKVHRKDDTISDLRNEIDNLTDNLEQERVMVEQQQTDIRSLKQKVYETEKKMSVMSEAKTQVQEEAPVSPAPTTLKYEQEELANKNEQDQNASRRMMENAKLEQAKEMEAQLRKLKEQALNESRSELESMQEQHNERVRQLTYEKKMLEELLAKAKSEGKARTKEQDELEKVKRNEQRLANEVAKLKREIDRVHKTWEKKFAILQQSLHALKDESYLRQTMQRQAVQLHQAAISYTYDSPLGIAPTNQKAMSVATPSKKPLPDIRGQRAKSPADYISYTVSAPSGRATTLFSAVDENQVMSEDDQDFPSDVQPLPTPPVSQLLRPQNEKLQSGQLEELKSDQSDEPENLESRPSTVKSKSSHVVVLPTTNDQL